MAVLGWALAAAGVAVIVPAAVKKSRGALLAGLGILVLGAVAGMRESADEFWAVDSCLDAGGRYDAPEQRCEFR